MDHVAIMNPKWKSIPRILSGKKTIESRWYQTRRTPWNVIKKDDRVYFKNSGELVTAFADVTEVFQFELRKIDDIMQVIKQYESDINLVHNDPTTWSAVPKYCILVRLIRPKQLRIPFAINKQGFGSAAAWITVPSITSIRV